MIFGGGGRERFTLDDGGQWWYRFAPTRPRKRVTPRVCAGCGDEFLSPDYRQVSCSHICAAKRMHARKAPTTTAPAETLRNSSNPRFTQDESGQWWYTPIGTKRHGRTRASVKTCALCGGQFLASVYHRKYVDHCSRSCALRASYQSNPEQFTGERAKNWKGGRRVLRGYVWVWNPDAAQRARKGTQKPYVLEHRLVMEQIIGRPLRRGESVHHKNGIRDDNRPENLELWVNHQPPGQRAHEQKHCPTCTCNA